MTVSRSYFLFYFAYLKIILMALLATIYSIEFDFIIIPILIFTLLHYGRLLESN